MVTFVAQVKTPRNLPLFCPLTYFSMPLISDNGAALGVVAKTYLDSEELKVEDGKITKETRDQLKSLKGEFDYFKMAVHDTLKKDLRTVWRTWEAVYAGVEVLGKDGNQKAFEGANQWVSARW